MSITINEGSYSRNTNTWGKVPKFRQLYRLFLSLRSSREELFPLQLRILSKKLSRIVRHPTVTVPEGTQQIFLILCPYLLQKVGKKEAFSHFVSHFLKLLPSLLSDSWQENLIFHPKKAYIYVKAQVSEFLCSKSERLNKR